MRQRIIALAISACLLICLSASGNILATNDNNNGDLNSLPGAIGGEEMISVQVSEHVAILEFIVGNGSDPYETNNATVSAYLRVVGAGRVEVHDQNGNILYSYDKTTDEPEYLYFDITLTDGVGKYILTATVTNAAGESDSSTAQVVFNPLWAGPGEDNNDELAVPDTGKYLYIGGYAIPSFWAGAILIGFIALLSASLFLRKQKRSSDEFR